MSLHEPRTRPGRPRDPACDAAIFDAVLDLFVEDGYRGLSVEGIAARAGVGKATIYRRYSNKAELLVDAMRDRLGYAPGEEPPLPDTGDLRADVLAQLRPLVRTLRSDDGPLLVAFMLERARHPELAEEFNRAVIGRKRDHLEHLVRRAVERGELPADTDVAVVVEAAPAIIWHHALHDLPIPADLAERVVQQLLG